MNNSNHIRRVSHSSPEIINWKWIVLGLVGMFAFMFFLIRYEMTQYDKYIRITRSSELNLQIKDIWINHGTIVINREYVIGSLEPQWYQYSDTLWSLPKNTYLIKKSNSDSLFFTHKDNEGFYLILK